MGVKNNWGDSFRDTSLHISQKIEELTEKSSRPSGSGFIPALRIYLQKADRSLLEARRQDLEKMISIWRGWKMTEDMAQVCLVLAERSVLNSKAFRVTLDNAIRLLMPPAFACNWVLDVLSDQNITVSNIVRMYRGCQTFQPSSYCFIKRDNSPHGWFKAIKVSKNESKAEYLLYLELLDKSGVILGEPFPGVLQYTTFFQGDPKTIDFTVDYSKHGDENFNDEKWITELMGRALSPITREQAQDVLLATCDLLDNGKTISGSQIPQSALSPNTSHDTQNPKPVPPQPDDRMDKETNYASYASYKKKKQESSDLLIEINKYNAAITTIKKGAVYIRLISQLVEVSNQIKKMNLVKFGETRVSHTVVLGCMVTLSYEDGQCEKYAILGEYDTDLKHGYISYKTPKAQALRWKTVGDRTAIPPFWRNVTIEAIEPLPPELIRELDCE